MQNSKDKKDKDDLHSYRPGALTVIQLMTVLAVLGFLVTCLLRYFFM